MNKLRIMLLGLVLIVVSSASAEEDSNMHFPTEEWLTQSPNDAGWNPGAIDKALEQARDYWSSSVIILKDGQIVVEQYWPAPDLSGTDPRFAATAKTASYGITSEGYPLEDVASVQKSVTAVLAAIAREKGLISYEDPVDKYLGHAWANITPEQSHKITLRHLMSHTSGLTESLVFEAEPGTKWNYNTGAYQNLMRILAKASGMDENALTAAWLSDKIGMAHTKWVVREWAKVDPPMMGLVTTPRDLARFGLLVANHGRWMNEQIVPAPALAELLVPSQKLNPSYGLLWWLNTESGSIAAGSTELVAGKRVPDAPGDMVTAAGALNRYVFVLPTEGVVIVRTGIVNPRYLGEGDTFDKVWWQTMKDVFNPI